MDLVAGVRKEGSRGGRADFKWSDVEASTHRENYLGHSLMAPVGRWQKNKDLSWYAKGDKASEDEAAEARREEIRKVKEAEREAMGQALGFSPVDLVGGNANETPLGDGRGKEGAGGTPEERALRRIVEEEGRKGGRRSRSHEREGERERRRRRRDDYSDEEREEERARRRHHHRHYRHRDREHSRDRSRERSRDERGHRYRYRDERYRERSYDRRRSRSRDRRRSYSREKGRDYERRR